MNLYYKKNPLESFEPIHNVSELLQKKIKERKAPGGTENLKVDAISIIVLLSKIFSDNNLNPEKIRCLFPKANILSNSKRSKGLKQFEYVLFNFDSSQPISEKSSQIIQILIKEGDCRFYKDAGNLVSCQIGFEIENLKHLVTKLKSKTFIKSKSYFNLNLLEKLQNSIWKFNQDFHERYEDVLWVKDFSIPSLSFNLNNNIILIEYKYPKHRLYGSRAYKINAGFLIQLFTLEDHLLAKKLLVLNNVDQEYLNHSNTSKFIDFIIHPDLPRDDNDNDYNQYKKASRKVKIKGILEN